MVSSNMITQRLFSSTFSIVGILALFASATAAAQTETGRKAVPRPTTPATAAPGNAGHPRSAPLTGTLTTSAARSLSGAATGLPTGIRTSLGAAGRKRPLGVGVYVPLTVVDAPVYGRGSSTLEVTPASSDVVIAPSFYPTMQPPVWRIVAEEHPVQGWRVVDVTDVVCDVSGLCSSVTTRMLARWAPSLRAYAFRDRVGRIWRVE